jgi:hypothetical protein
MNDKIIAKAIVVFVGLLVLGWFVNIYRFFNCDFDTPLKEEVIRAVGIFVPPVGGVIGYIDIDDNER